MRKNFKNLKTGFDTERLRSNLLENGNLKALIRTYNKDFPEIKNQNSPKFWDEKFTNEVDSDLFPMSGDRNNIVASLIKPNTKVLDIGAGKGYLEEIISKKIGKNVDWTGTDFTKKSLAELNKKFGKKNKLLQYNFVQTGILKLPFKKNSFDTVCLLEVLEHISPTQTFSVLAELYRVTKKGGQTIISVPINEGLEAMMPYNPNSHLRVYSEEILAFETKTAGFKIKKVIRLSAFAKNYTLKKMINSVLKIKEFNNLIFVLEK